MLLSFSGRDRRLVSQIYRGTLSHVTRVPALSTRRRSPSMPKLPIAFITCNRTKHASLVTRILVSIRLTRIEIRFARPNLISLRPPPLRPQQRKLELLVRVCFAETSSEVSTGVRLIQAMPLRLPYRAHRLRKMQYKGGTCTVAVNPLVSLTCGPLGEWIRILVFLHRQLLRRTRKLRYHPLCSTPKGETWIL